MFSFIILNILVISICDGYVISSSNCNRNHRGDTFAMQQQRQLEPYLPQIYRNGYGYYPQIQQYGGSVPYINNRSPSLNFNPINTRYAPNNYGQVITNKSPYKILTDLPGNAKIVNGSIVQNYQTVSSASKSFRLHEIKPGKQIFMQKTFIAPNNGKSDPLYFLVHDGVEVTTRRVDTNDLDKISSNNIENGIPEDVNTWIKF